MKTIKYRRAYAQARLNLPLDDDSIESIAATIAAQDRRKRDCINDRFTFLLDLKGGIKERPQRRRKASDNWKCSYEDENVFVRREKVATMPDLWAD